MKSDQVTVGKVYTAKITDTVVPVRIDAVHPAGGWWATNTTTNRKVRIKSPRKLRGEVAATAPGSGAPKPDAAPKSKSKPKPKPKPADRPRARKKLTAKQHATLIAQLPGKQDGAATSASGTDTAPARLSLLNAAAQVLAEAGEPMNCKQMVEQVTARELWSPRQGGKTPAATLGSAILREIQRKGADTRFEHVARGQFALVKGR